VTSKGQVTLPKQIRDALGLEESSVVEFELTEGGAILTPVEGGFLKRFGTVKPRRRPEDWAKVRAVTAKQVSRERA
jgi:AbrB family looped-hinge helix DNA binding protein